MTRLEGRNCLIVGGTGGIGLATARRFLQEGATVVVAGKVGDGDGGGPDADRPLPLETAELDVLRGTGRHVGFAVDARDAQGVKLLFDAALEFFGGRIDVLFHVAGISGRKYGDGPLHDCTEQGWDAVMDVNGLGTFLTNREAVRRMRSQPIDAAGLRGTVLNMGSVLAGSPSPDHFGTVAYAASKGAIRALTRAAAACYAAERIRFNLLVPGLIATPMAARAVEDPKILRYLGSKQPMAGGPGTAEDCAEAALFLCEPASRFVTGVELAVDGGWRVCEGRGEHG